MPTTNTHPANLPDDLPTVGAPVRPVQQRPPNVNDRRPAPTAAEEPAFTRGPARRPVPQVADPLLQWASGLQTKTRQIYAGWIVEAGNLADLDAAMDQAGFGQVTIKHGGGNLVTHWAIETATVFVVADGVQSIGEMGQTPDRYGIAFGWRRFEDSQRHQLRQQSRLRCRVFLRDLLMVGYTEPLLLTLKGTLTGDLIAALMRQYDVLETAAEMRRQAGKSPELPLYAFSLPLRAGDDVMRGNGSATKEITPMIAGVPTPIEKEYLLQHWIKRAWVPLIEGMLDQTIAWSVAESAAIAADADERPGWEGE